MKTEKTKAQPFAVREANNMPRALVPPGNEIEAMASSSCGDRKGRVPEMARPLRLQCRDCEELLHQLSNVITPILMHAQMLEWKLPPYSHLKRSVRELERNARRGSELLKALMRRAGDGELSTVAREIVVDSGNGTAFDENDRRPHKRV
jgi:hypothetical protein